MLIIQVSEHRTHVVSGAPLASGCVETPKVKFLLDEFWDGYAVTAQFTGGSSRVNLANITPNREYNVPWECITEAGVLTLQIFGFKGDAVATTTPTTLQVIDSGINSATLPQEPTPSAYQQYVVEVDGLANYADDCAGRAEAAANQATEAVESLKNLPALAEQAQGIVDSVGSTLASAENALEVANNASEVATEAARKKPEALVESNHGLEVRFWFGTKSEYAEQQSAGLIADTTYCVLTDDTTAEDALALVNTVRETFIGQYAYPEYIADALLISTDNPLSELNTHRRKITPDTLNIPAIDGTPVAGFYGIREPVVPYDDDIVAVVKITEIKPVCGRQWISYYSVNDSAWHNGGWAIMQTAEN